MKKFNCYKSWISRYCIIQIFLNFLTLVTEPVLWVCKKCKIKFLKDFESCMASILEPKQNIYRINHKELYGFINYQIYKTNSGSFIATDDTGGDWSVIVTSLMPHKLVSFHWQRHLQNVYKPPFDAAVQVCCNSY